ncbi:MAG TPA: SGNH hydrolase domain-containing protein [Actinoallomurus sp.]|jgi:hypothetical protein|nr:SGNH hydrolase domain-containing protein [Actinoallomurus sp.]
MWGAALALGLMMPVGSLAGGPPPPGPPSGKGPVAPPAVSSQAAPRLWVLRAEAQSPAAPYVGVIGDSTGSQLASALAGELRHRDVGVVIATVGGCQPTDVVLTFQSADYLGRHPNCTWEAPAKQREMMIRYHPKVVVWSDIMEWSDIRAEDGRIIVAGTGEWQRRILESWDRLLARRGDAHLVLVLPSWWAGWPANYPATFPVGRQRALFRSWGRHHADRVTVVDLTPVVCPGGPPCRQVVGGVRLRSDNIHFTPEGARRAGKKIMNDVEGLRTLHGPAA